MQIASTSELSCSIVGHNLVRIPGQSKDLTCKTCKSIVITDDKGSYLAGTIENPKIRRALQELFLLKVRFRRHQLSY